MPPLILPHRLLERTALALNLGGPLRLAALYQFEERVPPVGVDLHEAVRAEEVLARGLWLVVLRRGGGIWGWGWVSARATDGLRVEMGIGIGRERAANGKQDENAR